MQAPIIICHKQMAFNTNSSLLIKQCNHQSLHVRKSGPPKNGIQYQFLPRLNPAELCIRKVKISFKTEKYSKLLFQNVKVALYSAFDEIAVHDTLSFLEELRRESCGVWKDFYTLFHHRNTIICLWLFHCIL